MSTAATNTKEFVRAPVQRDVRTVRRLLRNLRQSEQLAELGLFGSHIPRRMLMALERRHHRRALADMPIYITPARYDGFRVEFRRDRKDMMLATTRDVSLRGVGFLHDQMLDSDYVLVTLDCPTLGSVSLLLEVRWANHEKDFSFMSGGRFQGIVDVDAADPGET